MRRTKEEARATRHRLLDAAERVFLAQGVAGTSLNDIAMEAGTTRGAIYWHFRDKADLFNAMMDRVTLPLQAAASRLVESPEGEDALPSLRSAIRAALSLTVRDPQTRRVFEIATHKVEYVDSLFAIRERHLRMRAEWVRGIRRALRISAESRGLRLPMAAAAAAHGLQALVDGLIQN
jgi:TetR/AcrR family transcriptional regulator, acrAB operon repressor